MSKLDLSSQAKWYLRGPWPIYRHTHADPEPKAMEELCDKGLAKTKVNPLTGIYWTITVEGIVIRNSILNHCPACISNTRHTAIQIEKYHSEAGKGFSKEHGSPKPKAEAE